MRPENNDRNHQLILKGVEKIFRTEYKVNGDFTKGLYYIIIKSPRITQNKEKFSMFSLSGYQLEKLDNLIHPTNYKINSINSMQFDKESYIEINLVAGGLS